MSNRNIFDACSCGDLERVKHLVEVENADVDSQINVIK